MLDVYRNQFNEIVNGTKGKRRLMLLSDLMRQMEGYYKLSLTMELFECDVKREVKELFLDVSKARINNA